MTMMWLMEACHDRDPMECQMGKKEECVIDEE